MTLEDIEEKHIGEILKAAGHNKVKAAKMLGLTRPALYRKLKKNTAYPDLTPRPEHTAPPARKPRLIPALREARPPGGFFALMDAFEPAGTGIRRISGRPLFRQPSRLLENDSQELIRSL